ncbi:MAG: hypothetical protein H6Q05_2872 [Acidobacteria bacterium]|nr:hypothetical protein [Acidobacteriota bacterium]
MTPGTRATCSDDPVPASGIGVPSNCRARSRVKTSAISSVAENWIEGTWLNPSTSFQRTPAGDAVSVNREARLQGLEVTPDLAGMTRLVRRQGSRKIFYRPPAGPLESLRQKPLADHPVISWHGRRPSGGWRPAQATPAKAVIPINIRAIRISQASAKIRGGMWCWIVSPVRRSQKKNPIAPPLNSTVSTGFSPCALNRENIQVWKGMEI